MERVIAEKKLSEGDFIRVYGRAKRLEKDLKLVRAHNSSLRNMVEMLEKSRAGRRQNIALADSGRKKDVAERRIRQLEIAMSNAQKQNEYLKSVIVRLNSVLSDISSVIVLKKLGTLGMKEFRHKDRVLRIRKNDILLVDNPEIASSEVISMLKEKVFVIVHRKPISKKVADSMPFVFVSAERLEIAEDMHFGFVDRRSFEIEKGRIEWTRKIIEDYKREKEQLVPW